ncbi:protein OSB1, mitochondrial [Impatiens glandulifera]|uniref:protein OSB1, mitochondrial n=1 Tax=Impatiens glandulifera TaxID=253017 RepID=UPI001FB0B17A|nr:protein OSB1, mitochondrial [Impatiens glandulifera]
MASSRIPSLIRRGLSLFSSLSLGSLLRPFSSSSFSSSPADSYHRRESSLLDDSKDDGISSVYSHTLKFQRPQTIEFRNNLFNLVTLIGTVEYSPKRVNTSSTRCGVHTILNVNKTLRSQCSLRVLLKMWNDMAEISMQHLKPNDHIYVSGFLASYSKGGIDRDARTFYEVVVKEINYVAGCGSGSTSQNFHQADSCEGETKIEKYSKKMYLWQVFFANPDDWWDNRKTKATEQRPDFKHKDTGEVLWLSYNDPPWIRKQLQLYDSRIEHSSQRKRLPSCIPMQLHDNEI